MACTEDRLCRVIGQENSSVSIKDQNSKTDAIQRCASVLGYVAIRFKLEAEFYHAAQMPTKAIGCTNFVGGVDTTLFRAADAHPRVVLRRLHQMTAQNVRIAVRSDPVLKEFGFPVLRAEGITTEGTDTSFRLTSIETD